MKEGSHGRFSFIRCQGLDLTHHIAGPYCTKLLAGLGADVLKVERPDGGDIARRLGPFPGDVPHPEKSGMFLYLNTGKKSITLNLKSEWGRMIIKELVKDVDLVVENFRPGVMASLGLDYLTLERINPRLIMTSISNFGQTGPYRDFKGSDLIVYALSILMYTTGYYEREPLKHGLTQAAYLGGGTAAAGTSIALHCQRETGFGQHVDVSLQEALISAMGFYSNQYAYHGGVLRRGAKGMSYGFGAIGQNMPCRDGWICPVQLTASWEDMCTMLDLPELLAPELGFQDILQRVVKADKLNPPLMAKLAERESLNCFTPPRCGGCPGQWCKMPGT